MGTPGRCHGVFKHRGRGCLAASNNAGGSHLEGSSALLRPYERGAFGAFVFRFAVTLLPRRGDVDFMIDIKEAGRQHRFELEGACCAPSAARTMNLRRPKLGT